MARLFISYKRQDGAYAFALRQWLIEDQGWGRDDIFVDLDQLGAGDAWAEKLFREAESCQVMLFLASEGALHPDSFCYRELRRARGPVLAVTIGDLAPGDERLRRAIPYESLARQIRAIDHEPKEPFTFVSPIDGQTGAALLNRAQVESIATTLRDMGVAPNSFDWEATDAGPYPGLAPLQEGDEALFHGRELEIRDGMRALEELRDSRSTRVFLIQAPSGAGKSSYLRAGLWRRLRNHAAFTPLAILRTPQGILSHPQWGLTAGLFDPKNNALNLPLDAVQSRVETDLIGVLGEIADADAGEDGRRTLLIGIDQAEEISALDGPARAECDRFLKTLGEASPNIDIRLVLTARDDSIDTTLGLLANAGFSAEMVQTYRLHRMSGQRYREIIRRPADAAGRAEWPLSLSEDLEVALADAVGEGTSEFGDPLPLLALALQRLVLRRRAPATGEILLPAEEAREFLDSAVSETVLDALTAAEADADALRRLVIPHLATWDPNAGESGAAKRLVAKAETLFQGDRAALHPLADALVDARLLTRTQGEDDISYEVAHEALLRVPPLGDLIFERREKYVQAQILQIETRDWLASEMAADHLARSGDRLRDAQALIADPDFGSDILARVPEIQTYLLACQDHAEAEAARRERLAQEEAEHRERQRQEELKLARERAEAAAAQEEAAKRERDAARQVATSARKTTFRTRLGLGVAVLLLLASVGLGGWAYQASIESAHNAETADKNAKTAQDNADRADQEAREANNAREEAEEQEAKANAEREAALINESRLLSAFARQEIERQDFGNAISLAMAALPEDLQNPENRPLTVEPQQILYDSYHQLRERNVFRGHDDQVRGALALSDGRFLTWSSDDTARLWQGDGTPGPVLRGHEGWVPGALALSDGRVLTWSEDGTARLWPGKPELLLDWGKEMNDRLQPLTDVEACKFYLKAAADCAGRRSTR